MSRDLRVAVLRGGPNDEYQHSLKVGAGILGVLDELGYPRKDIVVTKAGEWLDGGIVRTPITALQAVDVVFIAQRSSYAEDGEIQRIIKRCGVPFTGSNAMAHGMAYNKRLTKNALRRFGVRMPRHRYVARHRVHDISAIARHITDSFGPEYIIKPARGGSSRGLHLVRRNQRLADVLEAAFKYQADCDEFLVEEFIRGREATVALLDGFRGESSYVFPIAEVNTPLESPYHDTASKQNDDVHVVTPGRFSLSEREQLGAIASLAHQQIGLSQYSRSDFIVRDGDVYFLEINSLPQLSKHGLYASCADAVGLSYPQLIEDLVLKASS